MPLLLFAGLQSLQGPAGFIYPEPHRPSNRHQPMLRGHWLHAGQQAAGTGLGPLPLAAEAAEEMLCSATVHVPELVAHGQDVQVGGLEQAYPNAR
jgi:hypothetical protein